MRRCHRKLGRKREGAVRQGKRGTTLSDQSLLSKVDPFGAMMDTEQEFAV